MQPSAPSKSLFAARAALGLAALGAGWAARAEDAPGIRWPEPGGRLTLARPFAGSEISVRLSSRVAGAIEDLTWGGLAFLDAGDPGGAMQAAAAFGGADPCRRAAEVGGAAVPASSLVESVSHGRAWAETETRMGWWRPPGRSPGDCPRRSGPASDVLLSKRVAIGLPGVPNAIEVQTRFVLPEPSADAEFEALTAAMPSAFSKAWRFDPATGQIRPSAGEPGEQALPVVIATPEGSHALGVWSPARLPDASSDAGAIHYDAVVSPSGDGAGLTWTCAFHVPQAAAGAHAFTCYALVGSLADVRAGLATLTAPP